MATCLRSSLRSAASGLAETLAVFTGLHARGLFRLNALDDELNDTPVDVSINFVDHPTLAEVDSAPVAVSIASKADPSLEGLARNVAAVSSAITGLTVEKDCISSSTANSAELRHKQAGRLLILHEVGFHSTKKPRNTSCSPMYVYIYIHIYISIYIHTYMYIYTYIFQYIYFGLQILQFLYVFTYTHRVNITMSWNDVILYV